MSFISSLNNALDVVNTSRGAKHLEVVVGKVDVRDGKAKVSVDKIIQELNEAFQDKDVDHKTAESLKVKLETFRKQNKPFTGESKTTAVAFKAFYQTLVTKDYKNIAKESSRDKLVWLKDQKAQGDDLSLLKEKFPNDLYVKFIADNNDKVIQELVTKFQAPSSTVSFSNITVPIPQEIALDLVKQNIPTHGTYTLDLTAINHLDWSALEPLLIGLQGLDIKLPNDMINFSSILIEIPEPGKTQIATHFKGLKQIQNEDIQRTERLGRHINSSLDICLVDKNKRLGKGRSTGFWRATEIEAPMKELLDALTKTPLAPQAAIELEDKLTKYQAMHAHLKNDKHLKQVFDVLKGYIESSAALTPDIFTAVLYEFVENNDPISFAIHFMPAFNRDDPVAAHALAELRVIFPNVSWLKKIEDDPSWINRTFLGIGSNGRALIDIERELDIYDDFMNAINKSKYSADIVIHDPVLDKESVSKILLNIDYISFEMINFSRVEGLQWSEIEPELLKNSKWKEIILPKTVTSFDPYNPISKEWKEPMRSKLLAQFPKPRSTTSRFTPAAPYGPYEEL